MISKFYIILILALGFFSHALVMAYVPPSQYLVNQIAEKRKGKKLVWISSKLSLPMTAADGSNQLTEILVVDYNQNKIHSRLYNSKNEILFNHARKLFDGGVPGQVTWSDLTQQLLFGNKVEDLVRDLKSFGIPVVTEAALARLADENARRNAEQTALRRWNQNLLWVVGRDLSGEHRAQLWIEKDSFLPQRLLRRISDDGASTILVQELRLTDHRFSQSFNYPGLIQMYKNESLLFEAKMDKLAVDPKKQYPSPASGGFTELGQNENSEVRGMIEQFYQSVR